jgi:hypothetical protein
MVKPGNASLTKALLAGVVGLGVVAVVIVIAAGDDAVIESRAVTAEPADVAGAPAVADQLCVLHESLASIATPIGDVESEAEFETLTGAQVTFYGSAAGILSGAEASAFLGLAEYYEAIRRFYEARGWGTNLDLAAAAELPRPPNESAAIVRDLLQVRCGVVPPSDAPA